MDFSFAQTADLSTEGETYVIKITTNLTSDENTDNDEFEKTITSIFGNDVGVTEIISPKSEENLGEENVTITITNFGGLAQSNFDVSYTLNSGTPVVENYPGTLNPGESLNYTFTQTVTLGGEETSTLEATTLLTGDSNAANDALSAQIINLTCRELANTNSVTIDSAGPNTITSVISTNIDTPVEKLSVKLNIEHTYASDLTITLIAPDATEVVLCSGVGGSGDNFTETVFDDDAAQAIADGSAPFTGTFTPEGTLADMIGISAIGDWTLSVADGFNQDGGQLVDWSITFCGLEALTVGENLDLDNELKIIYKENNQFDIRFESDTVEDQLEFEVYNIKGQRLLSYRLNKENGKGYYYDLDMSYASTGVYLVRLKDSQNRSKVKKLVVK